MPKEEFEDLLERLNGERLFSKYNPCLTEEEIRDSTDQDSWGKLADLGKQAALSAPVNE